MLPDSPIQDFEMSVSPISRKQVHSRGGTVNHGHSGEIRVRTWFGKRYRQNNLSPLDLKSNDPVMEPAIVILDVEPDNNGDNVDLFEWNNTPRPLRQYGFIPIQGVKKHCQNWQKV